MELIALATFLINAISSFFGGFLSNQLYAKPKIKVFEQKFTTQDKLNENQKDLNDKNESRFISIENEQKSQKDVIYKLQSDLQDLKQTELSEVHNSMIRISEQNIMIKEEHDIVLKEVNEVKSFLNRLLNLEVDKLQQSQKSYELEKEKDKKLEQILKALEEK